MDVSGFVTKMVVEIQGENGACLGGKQFNDGTSVGTLEIVGVIHNLGHSLLEQIVVNEKVCFVWLVLRKTMEMLWQNFPQQHMQTGDL